MSLVTDILKRMKNQRMGKPLVKVTTSPSKGSSETYSSRVKVLKNQPKDASKPKPPPSCEAYSKKGLGAAAMTVPQLTDFIKQKAPTALFQKFTRLQKKTRPEICKILAEFAAGRELLYPGGESPRQATPPMPNAKNIEGMLNFAQNLRGTKYMKKVNRSPVMWGNSPSSAGSSSSRSSTPNYENVYNNVPENEEARVRERNMYLRRLAEKRVEKDPLVGMLSAANAKRFRVKALKGSRKAPTLKPRTTKKVKRMNLGTGNLRASTVITRGLVVSRSPRVNIRKVRNNVYNTMNKLRMTLTRLENVKPLQRTALQKTRIRLLKRLLSNDSFENRLFLKMKKHAAPLSPPKRTIQAAFSMVSAGRNVPWSNYAEGILAGKRANKVKFIKPTANLTELRRRYYAQMTDTFKIEGKDCMSYKKSKLVKVAQLYTKRSVADLEKLTKEELCMVIKQKY